MLVPIETVDALLLQYQNLIDEMSTCEDVSRSIALSKSLSELEQKVDLAKNLKAKITEFDDLQTMLAEPDLDAEFSEMAKLDLAQIEEVLPDLHKNLALALLPKDEADSGGVVLEIRAGTGGDEAAIFAGDLMRMYSRYAALQGWKVEIISQSEADMGGFKEIIAEIVGESVYAQLKFESGVHRVQRVPLTETQGRIHTSAATVAVLPEATHVEFDIQESDLRIDVYRASGAGGQHVNKTESAVRITHIPTGAVVAVQDDRSQHRNRAKAMMLLKAKLYDQHRLEQEQARSADRKSQIGSGDRSERIRTYNFPQGRLTDHRIGLTLYSLDRIVAGDDLGNVIGALRSFDEEERLKASAL